MVGLGLTLFGASVTYLIWSFLESPRQASFGRSGVAGILLMLAAAALLGFHVAPATLFITPIAWTGYILAVDAAVFSLRGKSLLNNARAEFGWMAALSVGLWLVFEAYNLRLLNWEYRGLPENSLVRTFGYLWSFATIWPAILETTELLLATRFREKQARPVLIPSGPLILLGAALLILPAALPQAAGSYLFGMVWLGFAFLLDPLNGRAGRSSIIGDLRRSDHARLQALLAAGLICGFSWEFWNYWSDAKWVYIFPISQHTKIFEMPALGYLGFSPFAVEVFAMYVYAAGKLRIPYYEVR